VSKTRLRESVRASRVGLAHLHHRELAPQAEEHHVLTLPFRLRNRLGTVGQRCAQDYLLFLSQSISLQKPECAGIWFRRPLRISMVSSHCLSRTAAYQLTSIWRLMSITSLHPVQEPYACGLSCTVL